MMLISELRAGGKLLGKLFVLDDGRRVVELACRGRECEGLCYFEAETGEAVDINRLSVNLAPRQGQFGERGAGARRSPLIRQLGH